MIKKLTYLLFLFNGLMISAQAQTDWITKKLDEKLSVKFPSEPEKSTKNGAETYIVKTKDSVKYAAVLLDLNASGKLDSATLAKVKDNQQFANQLLNGIASQKPNYTFDDVKIGNWKSYTSYDFSGLDKETKAQLTVKLILIGTKIYSFSCLLPKESPTQTNELFFGSIELF